MDKTFFLNTAKQKRLAELQQWLDDLKATFTGNHAETEQATWYLQLHEARVILLDEPTPTPLLDELAANDNTSRTDYAHKVTEQAQAFAQKMAQPLKLYRKAKAQIEQADSLNAVAAIEIPPTE